MAIETVIASPTKRFFVDMITRDIELQDAILDLLDNCVDGILRTNKATTSTVSLNQKPYDGFYAKITLNKDKFEIEDNCGGIPKTLAKKYAFMFGRPKDEGDTDVPTVGIYGIGMKRAIFKFGSKASVISRSESDYFKVEISSEWLKNDTEWDLPLTDMPNENCAEKGTKVNVELLHQTVSKQFSNPTFVDDFYKLVAQHYSLIIGKGFDVEINGQSVKPKNMTLLSTPFNQQNGLTPYLFKASIDDVSVRLAVGFRMPMSSPDEDDEQAETPRKTEEAGWTVICNDRVVLYNDRTRLTGWGDGAPSYHTQFIGISGYVEFRCNDAWKLPITTTKRGIDTNNELYSQVRVKMREGLKKFTSYTNRWKGRFEEEKKLSSKAESKTIASLFESAENVGWSTDRKISGAQTLYIPLAEPENTSKSKRVIFTKPSEDICMVAAYLFDDETVKASIVGEECFDRILKEAIK